MTKIAEATARLSSITTDGMYFGASPVNFDLNADGTAEALPWTAPADPLLVWMPTAMATATAR